MTMLAVMVLFLCAGWRMTLMSFERVWLLNQHEFRLLGAGLLVAFGCWFAYRLVQFPAFADFLVSVEAEMIKVYWPSYNELYSSTIVVLVVFVLLAASIFMFDTCWQLLFRAIGVLPGGALWGM